MNTRTNNLDKQMKPAMNGVDQSITIATTAIGVTVADFAGNRTTHYMVTIDGADVRMRFDGTDPTASVGHFWPDKTMRIMSKEMLVAAKFIRDSDTSALMHVSELVY